MRAIPSQPRQLISSSSPATTAAQSSSKRSRPRNGSGARSGWSSTAAPMAAAARSKKVPRRKRACAFSRAAKTAAKAPPCSTACARPRRRDSRMSLSWMPTASIPPHRSRRFMSLSRTRPEAMILGVPVFDATAPRIRVIGRRVSNSLARLETLGAIGDSLFGFRIYPIAPLRRIMEDSRFMRRFDFDVEASVRLCWQRRAGDQCAGAGAIFPQGRRRRLAFPLCAGQSAARADASALARRLSPASARPRGAARQIIPPLMPIVCPEM